MQVVGIFNADGGLRGEMRYVAGKILGRVDCGLCDLTHGWNPLGKRSWAKACQSSPVVLRLIHRNRAHPAQLAATGGKLPAVIAGEGEKWQLLVDAQRIKSFGGDPDGLLAHIEQQVAQVGTAE